MALDDETQVLGTGASVPPTESSADLGNFLSGIWALLHYVNRGRVEGM